VRCRGLTLIEIMVTVTLLVVIILGLTAMFNQTRKAFTVGLSNVEYQDAGRAAMDLITRDLQQMAPTYYSKFEYNQYLLNPFTYVATNGLNFYASPSLGVANHEWPMIGGDVTNFSLGSLFFVTRYNQQWSAIGYRLIKSDITNGVGTLYRFSTNNPPMTSMVPFQVGFSPLNTATQIYNFRDNDPPLAPASWSRVIDGVVDFRIRTYDRNGLLIPTLTNGYVMTAADPRTTILETTTNYTGNASLLFFGTNAGYWVDPNVSAAPLAVNTNIFYSAQFTGDYEYQFTSNAVPAYVDIELGIMETPTLQQLQALTNTPAAYLGFLTNHAAQVHIFRQRVTIPSTDPAAYP
jgi:prepilin-type N-terminal cleavage/methylation domain-containing protein